MRIFFTLRVAADVDLEVYNVAGEPIVHLQQACAATVNEIEWKGLNEAGGKCASGVYLVRLSAVGRDKSTGTFWTTVVIVR